ncbi:competence type IV pilus assembly protein ComGB [Bacillus sp. JJ1503]|uniref:competence type IV pilus assembly protein ComGB n=1 Tax=unclassified Bacillus (in: firmicutes) TaxID=185979 RepID=UPI0030005C09
MRRHKWSLQEQSHFLKRTGELLSRGYPLSEAIESILFQLPRRKKKEVGECLSDLREGYPFYQILSKLQFNRHLIGYVYFAEQHGGLAQAFQEGSEMMLKRDRDLEKLKKLLVYPVLLIFITLMLFIFVDYMILPRFSSLFSSMKLKPNFFMKAVSFFGNIMPFFFVFCIFFCAVLLGYYLLQFRKNSQVRQKSKLVSIPLMGPFLKLFYSHYFSIQISYLLSGGLSIHEALRMFKKNEKQPLYQELGADIIDNLRKGERLEDILMGYSFLEAELPHIIRHGQKNGKLDQELAFFSKHCLTVIEERSEKLLKTIQPILYSVIGVMIVFMYLAVLLPMFHLLEGI